MGKRVTLNPLTNARRTTSASGGQVNIINDLTSTRTDAGLSANMGRVLDESVTSIDLQLQTEDGTPFYFDQKDGVFGFNTDEERGADTFHPFSSSNVAMGISDERSTGVTTIDCGFRPKYLAVLCVESAMGMRIYNEDYSTSKTVKSTTSGIATEPLPSTSGGQIKNITDYGFEFNNNSYNKIFRYFAIG